MFDGRKRTILHGPLHLCGDGLTFVCESHTSVSLKCSMLDHFGIYIYIQYKLTKTLLHVFMVCSFQKNFVY